jgi:SagB-type dehydrogenase family enzyme
LTCLHLSNTMNSKKIYFNLKGRLNMGYGDDFQHMSKYRRNAMEGRGLDWNRQPELYKKYPADLERFELEKPEPPGGGPLYALLQQRRSVRRFRHKTLGQQEFSQILWAAQGITLSTEHHQFRTAPSAGGLYPVETYIVTNRVEGLKAGTYHYEVPYHGLVLLEEGNFGSRLAEAGLGQKFLDQAAFVFVWSAVIERSKWKYDQRAYRYIYMDAGHIAQNAALAAVSSGLGSCQVAAFFDDEVNRIIGVDGHAETAIYMTAVGEPF